jgi:ribosomal protein S18 acetylase RimI-like enzyme
LSTASLAQRLMRRCPQLVLRVEQDDSDTDFLCALYAATRREELAHVPWPDEAKLAFLSEQFQLQRDHYRKNYVGAEFLVIEDGGERIGRIYLYPSAREIRLMDIAVIEPRQRQGVGGALVRALLDIAREDAVDITLHVETNNPALRLYDRLGFRLIEERGVYHFLGWTPPAAG